MFPSHPQYSDDPEPRRQYSTDVHLGTLHGRTQTRTCIPIPHSCIPIPFPFHSHSPSSLQLSSYLNKLDVLHSTRSSRLTFFIFIFLPYPPLLKKYHSPLPKERRTATSPSAFQSQARPHPRDCSSSVLPVRLTRNGYRRQGSTGDDRTNVYLPLQGRCDVPPTLHGGRPGETAREGILEKEEKVEGRSSRWRSQWEEAPVRTYFPRKYQSSQDCLVVVVLTYDPS